MLNVIYACLVSMLTKKDSPYPEILSILRKLEDIIKNYHFLFNMSVLMGDNPFFLKGFHDRMSCSEPFTICHYIYDHIIKFCISWVSNYLQFQCGSQYVYNRCDIGVQLQQGREPFNNLLDG